MVLAIVLVASTLAASPQGPAHVGPAEARALGELVTVSVARHKVFDVVSSADLRRVVELEADKATLGCTEAGSCLAELAGAMGARYVVFGQIAPLGSQLALTLNLFDSAKGSSSGRVVLLGADVDAMIPHIDAKVDALVADAAAASAPPPPAAGAPAPDASAPPSPSSPSPSSPSPSSPPPPSPSPPSSSPPSSGARVRVLVLDLELPAPAPATVAAAPAPQDGGPSLWMLAGGGAAAVVGGAAAATGGYFGVTAQGAQQAALAAKFQDDRVAALSRRDESALTANVLYGAGAVLAAGGAALALASFFVEGP